MYFSGTLFAIVCAFSFVRSGSLRPRIINGTEADQDYPWVARILTNTEETPDGQQSLETDCGGTLIASQWVLTAKHCLLNEDLSVIGNPEKYQVIVGNNYWPGGQFIPVTDHYFYSDQSYIDDDIAMLKLEHAPKDIDPIPTQFDSLDPSTYDGKKAHILGWGLTDPTKDETITQLRETYVKLYTEGCEENVLCFNPKDTNTNSCEGDSGGPMTMMLNEVETMVGVTHVGQVINKVPCSVRL
ncbi:coagulation factor XI-like [Chrysoperla carnea]|uniref:coagulation factor XI-like n=1 Tax=Chrysoperla carnea TaxID=189513 RepID=UPI001D05FAF1|nr:coagulation factor XI-like [Chrysoperla carnea]